jgi:hypothetical protein
MGNFIKFMVENFIDEDLANDFSVSSENASYIAENVRNAFRANVWRSKAGYFNVTALNKDFVINDGTDKTISLTEASYTLASDLATDIQTQLNASSTDFTVAYSTSTNKFTISRTSNFSILWTNALTTAAELLGFDDSADDTGTDTYEADSARICYPGEWLKIDFGTAKNPKGIIILDKKGDIIKISPSAVITLQANSSDSWASPAYEKVLTYGEDNIVEIDTDGLFDTTYRYARLLIEDLENALGYVQLGVLYLGDVYELESSTVQRDFQEEFEDLSEIQQSESGEEYADIKAQRSLYSSVNIQLCTKTDVNTIMNIFQEFGTHTPFFVSIDSTAQVTDDINEWTKYVKFTSPPSKQYVTNNRWNVSFSLKEVI